MIEHLSDSQLETIQSIFNLTKKQKQAVSETEKGHTAKELRQLVKQASKEKVNLHILTFIFGDKELILFDSFNDWKAAKLK